MENIIIYQPILEEDTFETRDDFIAAKSTKPSSVKIAPERINKELNQFLKKIDKIDIKEESGYELSEIEFSFGITTKGKLALLGSGIETGITAGIKVKIKKK
jgi:hypothetical protein